jgi:hypothetical protein
MKRIKAWVLPLLGGTCLAMFPGCPAEGVGDPCVPEDEYTTTFSGFSLSEVSTESRSFQCQSRLCLVNHFQGRVSCPYGQTENDGTNGVKCRLPGTDEPVQVAVPAQLVDRRAEDAVYCSCRCAGPDANARYCECPSGFSCSPVVPAFELGSGQLPGSYCVREGTEYVDSAVSRADVCDAALGNCAE